MSDWNPPVDSPEIRRLTPVIGPGHTFGSVTDKISSIVLTRPTSLGWYIGFLIAFSLMGMMTIAIGWLIIKGVGIWGINIPIGWRSEERRVGKECRSQWLPYNEKKESILMCG